MKAAAKSFISRQDLSQDSFAVVGFGNEGYVSSGLTSDLSTLNQAIDSLAPAGATRMDLGLSNAIEELGNSSSQPNILLFTDGQPGGQIAPQAIALVIDTSGSMNRSKLAEVKAAATAFVQRQDLSQNQIAVIGFGSEVEVGTSLTSHLPTLTGAIAFLNDGGGTRMDIAIDAATNELLLSSDQRYIVLFTDGIPGYAGANLETEIDNTLYTANQAKQEEINLIAVGTGDADTGFLSQLTGNSDLVFYANSGNFDQAFQQVEQRLSGSNLEQAIADTLAVGNQVKQQEINLVAVGTGDADREFLSQLTGNSDLVFYADSGNFDQAFLAAEASIYQPLLIESEQIDKEGFLYSLLTDIIPPKQIEKYSLVYSIFRIGTWTAILSLGTSLALIIGQNCYQRRRLLSPQEATVGTIGSIAAGIGAGSIGQMIYTPLAAIPIIATGGQILGWTILGVFLGGGMSLFVRNLNPTKAFLGGGMGGLVGGISFIVINSITGAIAGRLVGSDLIGFAIGIMIALTELLSKEARLIVQWTPTETRAFLLGKRPIVLGSSYETDIYLPKSQGYPLITAKIFQEGEKIILQFDEEMRSRKKLKILRQELKDGDRRKFGDVILQVNLRGKGKG